MTPDRAALRAMLAAATPGHRIGIHARDVLALLDALDEAQALLAEALPFTRATRLAGSRLDLAPRITAWLDGRTP